MQFSIANDCTEALSTRGFHVRWAGGGFTKTSVTSSTCTSDPSLPASPAGFNKQVGTAAGTLIGGGAGTVSWTFKDGGPGGVAGVTPCARPDGPREADGAPTSDDGS